MNPLIATSTNINLDTKTLEQCLKSISHFGETVYQNICTGQMSTVPWGGLDWFLFFVLGAIGIGLAGALIGMLLRIIFDL